MTDGTGGGAAPGGTGTAGPEVIGIVVVFLHFQFQCLEFWNFAEERSILSHGVDIVQTALHDVANDAPQ